MKKFYTLILLTAVLTGCGTDMGIIGSADGPTAIMVASTGGEGIQMNYFTEMPVLPDVPTPPGSFSSAWEHPEDGTLTIITEDIGMETFEKYLDTLEDAGYVSGDVDTTWEIHAGNKTQIDTVYYEGSGCTVELSYDQEDAALVCRIDRET